MYVEVCLTAGRPYIGIANIMEPDDPPYWACEIHPTAGDASEVVAFMADSLADLRALAAAIVTAVDRREQGLD